MARSKACYINLIVDLSDEEAIIGIGSWEAVDNGDGDMLTYLKHYSLGHLTKGRVLTDVTMADLAKNIGRRY